MKHLSTLIAVKNLTIIQFTKIIQDLFYLDEFILDSLIIHLENCTIYHDESAIARKAREQHRKKRCHL